MGYLKPKILLNQLVNLCPVKIVFSSKNKEQFPAVFSRKAKITLH